MGFYINPKDGSKESWLISHGLPFTPELVRTEEQFNGLAKAGLALLCWVDNGPFTALAIAFNYREFLAFRDDRSGRPKRFYVASKEDVIEQVPAVKELLDPSA